MSETRKVWGENDDGTPFVRGLTVQQLTVLLNAYPPETEVCMAISPYFGLPGKALGLMSGTSGQVWIEGFVVDPSIAQGHHPTEVLQRLAYCKPRATEGRDT